MPLFDHFPYSNLHELNLNWVIGKLKDVDKAQMTAAQAADLLNQVSGKADDAAGSALAAKNSADAAAESQRQADLSAFGALGASDAASGYANTASQAKNDAVQAKDDAIAAKDIAVQAKDDAVQAKDDAVSAASDAHSDALDAAGSAADALADANRAQAYGASTGVASLAGSITAQSSDDVSLNDGTYMIIHFGTDSQSSKGINMFTLAGSTMVRRNLLQTGANIVMSTSGANVVHIVNYMTDGDMYYLILGYMEP